MDEYHECFDDDDCIDTVCHNSRCIPNNEERASFRFSENKCKDKNPDRPHCLSFQCVAGCVTDSDCQEVNKPYCAPETKTCVECLYDDDCGNNYFCAGSMNNCKGANYDTCMKLSQGADPLTIDGQPYHISQNIMCHRNAQKFCNLLGKSLIPLVEFNTESTDEDIETSVGIPTPLIRELSVLGEKRVWTSTILNDSCFAYGVGL